MLRMLLSNWDRYNNKDILLKIQLDESGTFVFHFSNEDDSRAFYSDLKEDFQSSEIELREKQVYMSFA